MWVVSHHHTDEGAEEMGEGGIGVQRSLIYDGTKRSYK